MASTFDDLHHRDRRDELGATTAFNDSLGWLTLIIKLPMANRVLIRRVQDRLLKKFINHA